MTRDLAGIVYPSSSHVSMLSRGTSNGAGGCSLSASLITSFRYLRLLACRSASVTTAFLWNASRICPCNFFITAGFRISSDIAHSNADADVPVPPANMSCTSSVHIICVTMTHGHVDEVLVGVLIIGGTAVVDLVAADAPPLVDDLLQDGVDRLVDAAEAALHAGDRGERGGPRREEVGDFEAARQPDAGLDGGHELRRALPLPPERRARHDVVGRAVEQHAQVHRRRRRRRGADLLHPRRHLVLPDVAEGEDALGAEDLGGAELAELAPVVAGGGEEDVGPAVADDLAGEEPGPGGEVGVVGLEHRARRPPRRRHHHRRLAEPQHHQRAVHAGQVTHRAVRQRVHEVVHAADHRQPPWPRRRPRPPPHGGGHLRQLQQRHGGDAEQQR
ncbi:Os03g0741525, partial [Oryza sativa Japonica Group]